MKEEKTIIKNLVEQLQIVVNNKDIKIQSANNYAQNRAPYMVVVGIDKVENINVGLRDYKITVKILIDFFIKDDPEGYEFEKTKDDVFDFIEKEYLLTRTNLTNIEEGIVGCFLDDNVNVSDEISNKEIITLDLIMSKDE